MKKRIYTILVTIVPVCLIAAINDQPEIKLIAAKDRVLPINQRTLILEAAENYLERSDDVFVAGMDTVNNPYSTGAGSPGTEVSEDSVIVYDDSSILELIQGNFASQVRGTIAKGNVYYLQLNGGGMLEGGVSFPAKIPQIEGQSFAVTILEINQDGYVLKMNDVTQRVKFEKTSGITKDFVK